MSWETFREPQKITTVLRYLSNIPPKMPISINSNLLAMKSQGSLNRTTGSMSLSYSRLSSGLRITGASDDPAGLAVSASLRTNAVNYTQALRNVNDGLSLLAVTESAMSQLSVITSRQAELAEQSANGSYSNTQRQALHAEALALGREFQRIIETTQFNNLKTLDGSLTQGISIQAGIDSAGGLNLMLTGAFGSTGAVGTIGTGTFKAPMSLGGYGSGEFAVTGDINGDGLVDIVRADGNSQSMSFYLGNGNGTFKAPVSRQGTGSDVSWVGLADLNGDGRPDILFGEALNPVTNVLLNLGGGTFSAAVSYRTGVRDYSFDTLGDVNGDGRIDLITADDTNGTTSVLLGNGDGSFLARRSFSVGTQTRSVSLGDFNGDGRPDIVASSGTIVKILTGNGDGTFKAALSFGLVGGFEGFQTTTGDFNKDGRLDFAVIVKGGTSNLNIFLGNGDGTFNSPLSYIAGPDSETFSVGDFNGDGNVDFAVENHAGDDTVSILLGNGNGSFKARTTYEGSWFTQAITSGDFNGDGVTDLAAIGGNLSHVLLGNGTVGALPQPTFTTLDLTTQASARQSLMKALAMRESVETQRGLPGAYVSRLQTAAKTIAVQREQVTSAASRITDIDVAEETARLASLQILQQSAVAVLAQARQTPRVALFLLQS